MYSTKGLALNWCQRGGIGMLHYIGAVAAVFFCAISYAANPPDWWVHIANDRAPQVKTMLQQGADPNELSADGQPAIMQAIRDGAWNVYDLLAAHPKTVYNAININRETPLMYLAVVGETKRAEDLIRRGAMVNRLGWTPLQYAASKGHLDTVKMLIANKAIVNAPGPDGTTALMMAAYNGSEDVVQFLLNAGADVTMQNLQKYDAAAWARIKKHDQLADKLAALSGKVLAQRSGKSPQPGAKQDALPETNSAQSKPQSAPEPSSSRYFDLDRFNESTDP